jgi:hypothetical protein
MFINLKTLLVVILKIKVPLRTERGNLIKRDIII